LHRNELTADSCMKVYATYIGLLASMDKIKTHFHREFTEQGDIYKYQRIQDAHQQMIDEFREIFMNSEISREEIQNSFSVGRDGSIL
jgi:hypothetical protein